MNDVSFVSYQKVLWRCENNRATMEKNILTATEGKR